MPVSAAVAVLYADADVLVVAKPAGLLSVPGRLPENKDCLGSRLQQQYPDALNVHRLDQVTSGLMIYARNKAAQAALSVQFAQRQVAKTYIAVVQGLLAQDMGSVAEPLICDWPNRPRQMVSWALGKPALTHWRVLARDTVLQQTRVELIPVTGRSHQLRVHMQSVGHPLVGDTLYGGPAHERVLLHASALALRHPVTAGPLQFALAPSF